LALLKKKEGEKGESGWKDKRIADKQHDFNNFRKRPPGQNKAPSLQSDGFMFGPTMTSSSCREGGGAKKVKGSQPSIVDKRTGGAEVSRKTASINADIGGAINRKGGGMKSGRADL